MEDATFYLEQIISNQVQLMDRLEMYWQLILMGVAFCIGIAAVIFVGVMLWRLIRF